MKKIKSLLILAAVCALGFQAKAQVVLSSCNQIHTESFNTLSTMDMTGTAYTAATPLAVPGVIGWYATTQATGYFGNDNGSRPTADAGLRNYHSTGSPDNSLGYYAENGTNYIGLRLQNNTGSAISTFTITYTGEQWRRGNNGTTPNLLTFAYRTGTGLTTLSGTYTAVAALNFTAPQNVSGGVCNNNGVALDGNAAANRKTITATITLATPLAAGQEIMLRWQDNNYTCGDHGMSIDDVKVSFTIVSPTAGTISGATNICAGSQYQYQITGQAGTVTAVNQSGANLTVSAVNNNLFTVTVPNTTTSFTITNTVDPSLCYPGSSKTLAVNVLPRPVANTAPTVLGQNCNTVTLELSAYQDQILRWEYSTDMGLTWNPINNTSSLITYTINTTTQFRTVITRAGSTCYEVYTPATADYTPLTLPVLLAPVVTSDCSTSSIFIRTQGGAIGNFTIAPNPRNVLPVSGVDRVTYTNLPVGTYVISFKDATTGCTVSRSVTVGNTLSAPVLLDSPYATTRTSINPEWQKYNGVVSYDLQYMTPTGTVMTLTGITGVRRNVTGLLCDTQYGFRVRALCSTGIYSPYSDWKYFTTLPCVFIRESSDLASNTDFTLYPNPNNGNFSLTFEGENGTNGQVSVLDLNGKTVAHHVFTANDGENTIKMNLDGVTGGIYLVRFQAGEVIKTQKIVVE